MKKLFLVRHAKAESFEFVGSDFERSLVKKGKQVAKTIALRLKDMKVKPDCIVTSPAFRSLETALILANILKVPYEHVFLNSLLYDNYKAKDILLIIKEKYADFNSIMLVGHNPVLTDVAMQFNDKVEEDIIKCGVVGLQFTTTTWSKVTINNNTLLFIELPEKKH